MSYDMANQSESYWKEKLSPDEYRIMREKGTEPAFTGEYVDNHEKGVYKCKACGQQLFDSGTKFDSGSGWPSFTQAVNRKHVDLIEDSGFGMSRTEVACTNCGSHLGHVFDDGPQDQGGQRYCINSACLDFDTAE